MKVPFELTWSCYKNEDVPCGKCDSCVRRAMALDDADVSKAGFYIYPEPSTLILLSVGLLVLYGFSRLKKKR